MTKFTAQLNGLRIAPRKVRLLTDLIKRKDVQVALDQLAHMSKRSSVHLVKLLHSAIANARNKQKGDHAELYISDLRVDEGTKLRRFRAKGFGRASPIEKKTSRITVVLEEKAKDEKPKAKS